MPWLSAMNDWRNYWLPNRRKRNEHTINFCGSLAAHWTQHSSGPCGNCGWDCLVYGVRFWFTCDWIRALHQRALAQSPVGAGYSVSLDLRNSWELRHCMAGSQPPYGPLTGGRDLGVGGQQSCRGRRVEHYSGSTLVPSSACADGAFHSVDWRKALAYAVTLANRSNCIRETAL